MSWMKVSIWKQWNRYQSFFNSIVSVKYIQSSLKASSSEIDKVIRNADIERK